MSTPVDIVMPYGVTVEGDGSWYPKIVGNHPQKKTASRLTLVPGPCRVAFSWAGESAADLILVNADGVKRPARLAEKRGGSTFCDRRHWGAPGRSSRNQRQRRARRNRHHRGLPTRLNRVVRHARAVV